MSAFDRIETAVAAVFCVAISDLRAPSRGQAATAFARQSAIYLAHVALGFEIAKVAKAFGRDRSTASHACRVVEDRRDDLAVDEMLNALERICQAEEIVP